MHSRKKKAVDIDGAKVEDTYTMLLGGGKTKQGSNKNTELDNVLDLL